MANPWEKYAGQGADGPPADPGFQYEGPKAKADLSGKLLDNQAAQIAIEKARVDLQAAQEAAAREEKVNKDLDARNQRIGILNALADQLVDVEKIYNEGFRGGVPNFIAGRVQPARADELNKAAAGLLDAGQTAFRIPGSGDQNPQELKFKLDAYLPSPTGTDAGNTQNFNYLRRRINAELKSLGQPEIDFDVRVTGEAAKPQDSVLNPIGGRAATKSETSALAPGQRFTYDEKGQPIGILDAQGNWVSGYGEIVGGNRDEQDDAARDTAGGAVDAFVRGAADWPTLGNSEKLAAAGNALLGRREGEPLGDAYWREMDIQNRTNAADERVNPWARFGGQFGGGVLAGGFAAGRSFPKFLGGGELPALSGRGMAIDAATGAAYAGSKSLDTGESLAPAIANGSIFGTLGGVGGRGGANIIGRGVSGITNPQVRRLYDAKVPMTFGQMLGQSDAGILPFGPSLGTAIKGLEDVVDGLGPLGAGVRAARGESIEGFNRAAFKEGGFPVSDIGELGVSQMKRIREQAYADALDGRTVAADLPFVQNVNDIAKASDDIKGMEGMFRDTLADRVGSQFDKGTRSMTGRGMQAAIRGLKTDAKKADASNLYMRSDQFGDAARSTEAELLALAERQNPGMTKAYVDANKLYMASEVLRKAVGRGSETDGIFTPAQLGIAAHQAAEKFGKRGGTVNRPFFAFQRAGQNILPSKIPDSGTIGRGASVAAIPYLVAGGAQSGFIPGVDTGSSEANTLAAIALLSSKGGRALSKKALLARTPKMQNAGKAIRKRSGLFGASVAPLPILISE